MVRAPVLALLLALTAACIPGAASAQWGPMAPGYLSAPTQLWSVDTVHGDDADQSVRRVARDNGVVADQRDSAATVIAQLEALTQYRPSATRRAANIRSFLARARAQDAAAAASLEAAFANIDLFATVDSQLGRYGLRTTNVADVFAAWWVNAWQASQGILNDTPDARTMMAVRRQAMLTLLATPGFAQLSQGQKQDMADEYVLTAVAVDGAIAYLAEHPGEVPAYRRAIRQAVLAQGMDLNAMRLTRDGFVPNDR